MLARDPAAAAELDRPAAVIQLLYAFRKAGADAQIKVLAVRAASRTDFSHPGSVDVLLDALENVGAQEQASDLLDKLPGEGLFPSFRAYANHRTVFRFGREADGSPSPTWGWDDLN